MIKYRAYFRLSMKLLSSVVWPEGMCPAPHHFQTQSRYFEDSLQFATTTLWYPPYGIPGFALDEDALRNGTVSLMGVAEVAKQ